MFERASFEPGCRRSRGCVSLPLWVVLLSAAVLVTCGEFLVTLPGFLVSEVFEAVLFPDPMVLRPRRLISPSPSSPQPSRATN